MWGLNDTQWLALTAIGTALYTVFTAVIAIFAFGAWRAARAQVRELRASTEAALRPVLIVVEANVISNLIPRTHASLKNIGPGPALGVGVYFAVTSSSQGNPVEFRMDAPAIPAGGECTVGELYPQQQFDTSAGYQLDVRIVYSDVFGNQMEASRSVVFAVIP